jgi:hypothetical protein
MRRTPAARRSSLYPPPHHRVLGRVAAQLLVHQPVLAGELGGGEAGRAAANVARLQQDHALAQVLRQHVRRQQAHHTAADDGHVVRAGVAGRQRREQRRARRRLLDPEGHVRRARRVRDGLSDGAARASRRRGRRCRRRRRGLLRLARHGGRGSGLLHLGRHGGGGARGRGGLHLQICQSTATEGKNVRRAHAGEHVRPGQLDKRGVCL